MDNPPDTLPTEKDGTNEVEAVQATQEESPSVNDAESHESHSCYDPATYPYPGLLSENGFARCHQVGAPICFAETYTRTLLRSGNGMPLWDPIGNVNRSAPHVKSSVMIGDVGLFDIRGDFAYYFNIFLPATDPAQQICPPNFEPFVEPFLASDTRKDPNHFSPGTTIVSPGVRVRHTSSSPLDMTFEIEAREAGIVILPEGASREDLVTTTRVRDYVLKHARDWYAFMNRGSQHCILCPNGSLCVVTGHDKATSWASCVALPYQDNGKMREIRYFKQEWTTNLKLDVQTSAVTSGYDIDHCAIFLRTMKFALSTRDWSHYVLHNDPPEIVAFHYMPTVPIFGLRASIQRLEERLFKKTDKLVSRSCNQHLFHPLAVVLQFLLVESQSDIAVVEDFTWNVVASGSDGSLSPTIYALIKLLQLHHISEEKGYVTLLPLSASQSDNAPSMSPQNLLMSIFDLFKTNYQHRRRTKSIAFKLSKIFPGPGVPSHLFKTDV